jgi:hypothetical protein
MIESHVALPIKFGQWIIDQPDTVLSAHEHQRRLLHTDYTFPRPSIMHNLNHVQVMKRDLTRRINTLTQEIWEELEDAFVQQWGTDTSEWKEVNVFDTVARILARTSNRVLVGKELC